MKIALSSLSHYIDCPLDALQLAEQLTMAGLEASVLSHELVPFNNVVVGQIIEVLPHPNADRLNICHVDCGSSHASKTIVCGASNVRKDLKVATALIGANLPNLAIQARSIRGVASEGMLCSITELGLETVLPQNSKESGIWELPEEFLLGSDLWEALSLDEAILDIQIPPNRGDCLSISGIAREIALLNSIPFTSPALHDSKNALQDTVEVKVKHPGACPRYTGRVIRDIDLEAKTPWWILKRLWQGGIKSISAVVDITNYILLERGAPLHAFDLDQLKSPLEVRFAELGEKITLLNDKEVAINSEALVIADKNGPVALAGIMGGLKSAVTCQTKNIFLESAYFSPEYLASKARQHGLMTESSYRFERGVDPELCEKALEEAAYLLATLCKGKAGPAIKAESSQHLFQAPIISLKHSHITKRLGIELTQKTVTSQLESLGMQSLTCENHKTLPDATEDTVWKMRCPSWRFDLKAPCDLIEELARLFGYDKIPATLSSLPIHFQPLSTKEQSITQWRRYLADQGFYEAINYSFVSSRHQKILDPEANPVILANPISVELDVLRTQLWPGLLKTLQHNYSHQHQSHRFFECGTVFIQKNNAISEYTHLAGLMTGNLLPEQWSASERKIDFFDIKHIMHHSLQLLDPQGHYTYASHKHPALHPGESCKVTKDNQMIGWLGRLHPNLGKHFSIDRPIYLFEFELQPALTQHTPSFKAFSRLPSMRRDIAFWIDSKVHFASIESAIIKSAGKYLKDIRLFDVYAEKSNTAQQSLALGLIWQHPERTLTDAEVDVWQTQVISTLESEWEIRWRR